MKDRKIDLTMITPLEFTKLVNAHGNPTNLTNDQEINNLKEFIENASANQLRETLLLSLKSENIYNNHYIKHLEIALNVRLGEAAAITAEKMAEQTNKLIQHTEQLTNQTATHIQHSEKLTQQTDRLIEESVSLTALTIQLKFWTIIIGIFAAVQIVIMILLTSCLFLLLLFMQPVASSLTLANKSLKF